MLLSALALSMTTPSCSLEGYRDQPELAAVNSADGPMIVWKGEPGKQLRLRFAITDGVPTIASLDMREGNQGWSNVLQHGRPEFSVDTGLRRMSQQQLAPLLDRGIPITQTVIDQDRWDAFWDAPLDLSPKSGRGRYGTMPPPTSGIPGTDQPGLPRHPDEISHANAQFAADRCAIRTDGQRIIVSFPGVTLGTFTGRLEYTIFRGTSLIRQEVLAVTQKPWVAYKFTAGIKSTAKSGGVRIVWHDTGGNWQSQALGAPETIRPTPLAAANRIIAAEQGNTTISVFPEPHRFFWARETAINMRYSWYRRDTADTFAIGVRQNDHEDSSEDPANWAMYSARPGSVQHMAMFLYPSLGNAPANFAAALAFTHGDRYKPMDGYKVMAHHYHMELGRRVLAAGGPEEKLPDLSAIRALGIDIASPVDAIIMQGFGPKTAPMDGPDQLSVIAASAAAARIHSDHDFLIMPNQEIFGSPLGGHTDLLFSHPVYWDQRAPGQPFKDSTEHGTTYHIGSAEDLMAMAAQENVIIAMPHPRTKGSTGYPDAVKDKPFFNDAHYDAMGMRWGMGLDGSERRLCDYRCWPLLDEMSNWAIQRNAPLKHVIGISEVMTLHPGDDIYASQPVTYVKLSKLPSPDDVSSVINALRAGDSFWTTGEVLLGSFAVSGNDQARMISADLSWTYPLDFIEIIWGDGTNVHRQVVSTTALAPNGAKHIALPVPDRAARWVRLAAWDIAANGAVSQPILIPAAARSH